MVDFPNSPTEGDTHTEEGQTWTYKGGAWVVGVGSALVTEIVRSGLPDKNWQIWGDTLIQWGAGTTTGGGSSTITLHQPFKNANYRMSFVPLAGDKTGAVWQKTTTTFGLLTYNASTGGAVDTTVEWIAIGEASDEAKLAKSVLGGDGGDLADTIKLVDDSGNNVQDGHTIIGNTLIQWGFDGSTQTVTFPIPFKATPRVVLSANGPNDRNATVNNVSATSFQTRTWNSSGAGSGASCHWIAIGPARDEDILPTEAKTLAGQKFEEFHDPTRAASYRITGKTLECWGEVRSGAGVTVTFPKTFAAAPFVRTEVVVNTDNVRTSHSKVVNVGDFSLVAFDSAGSVADYTIHWHAIGEIA